MDGSSTSFVLCLRLCTFLNRVTWPQRHSNSRGWAIALRFWLISDRPDDYDLTTRTSFGQPVNPAAILLGTDYHELMEGNATKGSDERPLTSWVSEQLDLVTLLVDGPKSPPCSWNHLLPRYGKITVSTGIRSKGVLHYSSTFPLQPLFHASSTVLWLLTVHDFRTEIIQLFSKKGGGCNLLSWIRSSIKLLSGWFRDVYSGNRLTFFWWWWESLPGSPSFLPHTHRHRGLHSFPLTSAKRVVFPAAVAQTTNQSHHSARRTQLQLTGRGEGEDRWIGRGPTFARRNSNQPTFR